MGETVKSMKTQFEMYIYNEELLNNKCNGIYNRIIKRIQGLLISTLLILLLFPVLVIISLAIILDSGSPVFYKANRGGYRGNVFKIYKFRTMVRDADKIGSGTTALNDSRITKIGYFLRKTKLDEIPQLINIFKGEMSFIGPRPELTRYVSQYDDLEKYILKVRPGITDFSSIEFINLDEIVGEENADEMYEKYVLKRKNMLRLKYVASISFAVDFKLFFLTVFKTIKKASKSIFMTGDINGKNYSK